MKQEALNYIENQINNAGYTLKNHTEDSNGVILKPRNIFVKIKKYANDFIENKDNERWIIIPGLRGVGKTTILAQTYKDLSQKIDKKYLLYISMDEVVETLGLSLLDLIEAYEHFLGEKLEKQKEKIFIFIDEVQSDEQWNNNIKTLLFNKTKNVFIITTGSSAVSLQVDADVSRRAVFEKLYPMSFCELELLKNNIYPEKGIKEKIKDALYYSQNAEEVVKKLNNINSEIRNYLSKIKPEEVEKYINVENLPFSLNKDKNKIYEKIKLLIDKVINIDIRNLEKFDSKTLLATKRLLFILADSLDAPSTNKISAIIEIHRSTLINILDVLEKAELLIKIQPNGSNINKSRKSSKFLFMSSTYRMALLSITGDKSTYLTRQGKVMEDVVGTYLYRDLISPAVASISYDPSSGGADFILDIENGKKIIIEVGMDKKDGKQILKTFEKIKAKYGIVISNSNDIISFKDNIVFLPFKIFLLS